MGHDHHFLARLDRASRAEADFALALYRDHEALQYILESARVPADAQRIALEIAPGGPHVIVQRDGHFVTCLGRGMSVGPHPVVTRARLDALLVSVTDLRARRLGRLVESRRGVPRDVAYARWKLFWAIGHQWLWRRWGRATTWRLTSPTSRSGG